MLRNRFENSSLAEIMISITKHSEINNEMFRNKLQNPGVSVGFYLSSWASTRLVIMIMISFISMVHAWNEYSTSRTGGGSTSRNEYDVFYSVKGASSLSCRAAKRE